MVAAILTLAILGLFLGAGLGFASKAFFVVKDPKLIAVQEALPGANCGACGYPGCSGMAEAIVTGKSAPSGCPVAGGKVLEKIAAIMGVEVVIGPKKVARVACCGDKEACAPIAAYNDIQNCAVMNTVSGGGKPCIYGCMGGGSCVQACNYGAIVMGANGLPVMYEDKCISCGLCVKACPRGLIRLIDQFKPEVVACSSRDKGADVRKICSSGCIGCRLCAKECPVDAIDIDANLALINAEKCVSCGACVRVCPTKAIKDMSV